MSKLKIERGASKIRRAPLKVTIDGTISDDLDLMCKWSENDSSYLVNLLLGFALAQSEDFQRYKADQVARSASAPPDIKAPADSVRKVLPSTNAAPPQIEKGVTA